MDEGRAGYRMKQMWVDSAVFPGKAGEVVNGGRQAKKELTPEEFQAELTLVLKGMDRSFTERLYGELASYARGIGP